MSGARATTTDDEALVRVATGNRGIQSFVLVKRGGQWRIKLFQNTRISGAP